MLLTAAGSGLGVVDTRSQWVLVGGAAVLYVSARAAVEAVAGASASPGRRALAHWIPVVAVCVLSVALKQSGLALAVIFATSVGALSLVTGAVAVMERDEAEPRTVPARWRRAWPFLLPASLLAFLAGFSGHLTWQHAVLLAAEGVVLLYVWLDPSPAGTADEPDAYPAERSATEPVNLVLAGLLSLIGAWAALKGTMGVSRSLDFASPAVIGTTALGPLLVAPMILTGNGLARRGRAWAATATHVGVVLLNLCALLPAVILLTLLRAVVHHGPHHLPTFDWAALRSVAPMAYPIITWRVDAVALVLLGFVLLPIAAGRWRLGRAEGLALIGVYVLYVLAVATVGVRA